MDILKSKEVINSWNEVRVFPNKMQKSEKFLERYGFYSNEILASQDI